MTTAPPEPPFTGPPPVAFVHPPPPERPELPDGVEPTGTPRWRAWTAWVSLIAGFAGAIASAIVLGIIAAGFGAELDDPPPWVNIGATVLQGLCLVLAAVFFARLAGRPRPADFGLRGTRFWPALGWSALAWGSFIVFTAVWVSALGVSETDDALPEELGADESDVALVAVAVLVCVIAPIVEEFFFRGYFFSALRSWRGIWPAALITGAVFGVIHAGSSEPAFLVPLGVFGFALCLLYVKTRSLYPCIAVHAVNNCAAFGASQDWGWQILPLVGGAFAAIALVFAVVQATVRPRAEQALG